MRPVTFSGQIPAPVRFGITADEQSRLQTKLVQAGEHLVDQMRSTDSGERKANRGHALQGVAQFLRAITEMVPEDEQG